MCVGVGIVWVVMVGRGEEICERKEQLRVGKYK